MMASSACVGGSLRIDGAEYLAVISDDRNALYVQGSAGETIGVIQGSCVDQPLRFFKQQTLGSAESYTSTGPSGAYCWLAYETKLELVWVGVSPQEPRLLSETMIIYGSMKAAGIVSSIHLLDSRQGSQALLAVVSKNVSSRSYVATVIETSSTLISAEKIRRRKDGWQNIDTRIDLESCPHLSISAPLDKPSMRCRVDPGSVRSWTTGSSLEIDYLQSSSHSFDVVIEDGDVGTSGRELVRAKYVTAQQKVVDAILSLGSEAFSKPETLVDFAVSSAGETVAFPTAQRATTLPLWQACMQLSVMSTPRYEATLGQLGGKVDLQNAPDWFRRQAVIETAMATGLSFLVSAYIFAKSSNGDASSDYLLEDVGRVQVWIGACFRDTEQSARALLRDFIDTSFTADGIHAYVGIPDRSSYTANVLFGLASIVRALVKRKNADFHGSESDRQQGQQQGQQQQQRDFALDAHMSFVSQLQQMALEITTLGQVLRTVAILASTEGFTLACLLPSDETDFSVKGVSMMATRHQDRLASQGDLAYFLPEELQCRKSVYEHIVEEFCEGARIDSERFLFHISTKEHAQKRKDVLTSLQDFLLSPVETCRSLAAKRSNTRGGCIEPADAPGACFGIILQFLLEAFYISLDDYACIQVMEKLERMRRLAGRLGMAGELTNNAVSFHLSACKTDIEVDLHSAARDLSTQNVSSVMSRGTAFAIMSRLLLCSHNAKAADGASLQAGSVALNAAKQLATHLFHATVSSSSFTRNDDTKLICQSAILVVAAASLHGHAWMEGWRGCRYLMETVTPWDDFAFEARFLIANMICRWTLLSGQLSEVLKMATDAEEAAWIESFLRGFVSEELTRGAGEAPTVDLYITWLLRKYRVADAEGQHNNHLEHAVADPASQGESVRARGQLIASYKKFEFLPTTATLRNVSAQTRSHSGCDNNVDGMSSLGRYWFEDPATSNPIVQSRISLSHASPAMSSARAAPASKVSRASETPSMPTPMSHDRAGYTYTGGSSGGAYNSSRYDPVSRLQTAADADTSIAMEEERDERDERDEAPPEESPIAAAGGGEKRVQFTNVSLRQ